MYGVLSTLPHSRKTKLNQELKYESHKYSCIYKPEVHTCKQDVYHS